MKDNPFYEYWKQSQEELYKNQSDWMSTWLNSDDPVTAEFLDKSKKSWAMCEEQYSSWMKTAENWFSPDTFPGQGQENTAANQMLKLMLDPSNFSRFSFEQMNSLFKKMVDGPDFADIGMFEKKFLKSGQDWLALCNASEEYQAVLAAAWNRAFKHYSDEFAELSKADTIDSKALLDRWLEIADTEMIDTLRSSKFLEAQRNFFKASTTYKLKHQEFVELWLESQSMPTRTEVDEMHKNIHQLRLEIRGLRKELNSLSAKPGDNHHAKTDIKQGSSVPAVKAIARPKPKTKVQAKPKAKVQAKPKAKVQAKAKAKVHAKPKAKAKVKSRVEKK